MGMFFYETVLGAARQKNKANPAGKQPLLQESFHTGAFTDFK
jgi:hypothetical protein